MKKFRIEGIIGWELLASDLDAFLDSADGEAVDLVVNSPGGIIPEGFSMINALRRYQGKINIQIDHAASMASVVAMTPGAYVTMWENSSMMMIHRAWGVAIGDADQLEQSGANLRKVEEISIANYLERAGDKLDEDELRDMLQAETVLNAKEAKQYGLIDRVLKSAGKDSRPKQLHLAPGVSVDLGKFAAKMASTSIRADIDRAESLRDVESALRDAGRFSSTDAKQLISRIRQLGSRDGPPPRHRDGGLAPHQHDTDQSDLIALCERIGNL